MVRLSIGYPSLEAQLAILKAQRYHNPLQELQPVSSAENVLEIQNYLNSVKATDSVLSYAVRLAEASRRHVLVELGISPRGVAALLRMARAHAVLRERNYVVPEDIQAVFLDTCAHRLVLRPQARVEGIDGREVLTELLQTVLPTDKEAR